MRRQLLSILLVSAASAIAVPAHAEKITVDEDTFFTIGVLAQPQLQITENAAPGGDFASDIFLRRGRLVLTGWFDAHIGFVFVTDQANYGKGGDYTTQFFIQDALAIYKFGPELSISAGMQLLPFVRNDYQSAGGLNAIDFRAGTIKFPAAAGKNFRDMGIVVSGLLAAEKVYYRAGVFSGVQGKKASDTVPEAVNEDDAPRLTANVRYNLLGKEEGYAFSGIYFAKDPIVNVGVGVDWQDGALGSTGKKQYLALSVDAFADYPLSEEMEILFQAGFMHYGHYATASGARDDANAVYAEAGVRYQLVEPLVAVDYFNGDLPGTQVTTIRVGLNWWISKHNFNVKTELAIPSTESVEGQPEPADPLVGTVQTQIVF
jgi:hypothetical protein